MAEKQQDFFHFHFIAGHFLPAILPFLGRITKDRYQIILLFALLFTPLSVVIENQQRVEPEDMNQRWLVSVDVRMCDFISWFPIRILVSSSSWLWVKELEAKKWTRLDRRKQETSLWPRSVGRANGRTQTEYGWHYLMKPLYSFLLLTKRLENPWPVTISCRLLLVFTTH